MSLKTNDVTLEVPSVSIVDQFLIIANMMPDNIAIEDKVLSYTYSDLEKKSRIFAAFLTENYSPGTVIALYGYKDFYFYAGLLAILRARCVLLTIDPDLPSERKKVLLQEAGAKAIFQTNSRLPKIDFDLPYYDLTQDNYPLVKEDFEFSAISNDDAAYIFFTSGSSGRPKGILGSHKGLAHFINWQKKKFDIQPEDRVGQLTSISFDVLLRDVFLPLCSGACAVVYNQEPIFEWIKDKQITILHCVPSLAKQWLNHYSVSEKLASLRLCFFAGEPLLDSLIVAWRSLNEEMMIVNLYGPTETTLAKCFYIVEKQVKPGIQPIGQAIDQTEIFILDENLNKCPQGVIGEIIIRTPYKSFGYLNKELNVNAFINIPGLDKEVVYRTGDLGKYNSDGLIEILGRQDQQIKIQGVRIEVSEIESCLLTHPNISQAVVTVYVNAADEKRLAAYFVTNKESNLFDFNELRGHLSNFLPIYMIPDSFNLISELPLNSNGKVDKSKLPTPIIEQESQYVEPTNKLDKELVEIWESVFQCERIGVNTGFFELGGHSLLAGKLILSINERYQISLKLKDLFNSPYISLLREKIERELANKKTENGPLAATKKSRPKIVPLSPNQQRLWLLEQVSFQSAVYNIPIALDITGEINVDLLKKAFDLLISKHEVLRTNFLKREGVATQVVNEKSNFQLDTVDLTALNFEQQDIKLIKLQKDLENKTFDLEKDSLIHACLVKLSSEKFVLFVILHHIIFDGASREFFSRDLSDFYNNLRKNKQILIANDDLQYIDFVLHQKEQISTKDIEKQLVFWDKVLADAPDLLELPLDYPRPAVQSYKGDCCESQLTVAELASLRKMAATEGVSIFMLLLTCWQALLYRYTGNSDILVGIPVANRDIPSFRELIGFFVNTLVIRADCSGNPRFQDLLHQVRNKTLSAFDNQDVSLEQILTRLKITRNLSHNPLFQTMFVHQVGLDPVPEFDDAQVFLRELSTQFAKFDISLLTIESTDGLNVKLEYASDLFSKETIKQLLAHYISLLKAISQTAIKRIDDIEILSDEEKNQQLLLWNKTRELPKKKSLVSQFYSIVDSYPNNIAVASGNEYISYRDLNERSNQLANYLRQRGIDSGDFIAVALDQSIEFIVCLLAIIKLGCVYVPIDTSYPKERKHYLLLDTSSKIVISLSKYASDFDDVQSDLVLYDVIEKSIDSESKNNIVDKSLNNSFAYVIYTSGSTGQPKGVLVKQSSIVNLVMETNYVSITSNDRIAQMANLSFDAITFEIWGALLNGAACCLVNKDLALDFYQLAEYFNYWNISILFITTALFNEIVIQYPKVFYGLSYLFFGGEAARPDLVKRLLADTNFSETKLNNIYGPTECTTFSTYYPLDRKKANDFIPIGKPLSGATCYVLGNKMQLLPCGVVGELYIGGCGLAESYLNKPELTQERFVVNPYSEGEKLYKTGDLVRLSKDGDIHYVGRNDQQVKIRGFRIELEEIVSCLVSYEDVDKAIVLSQTIKDAEKELVAYVILRNKKEENLLEIKDKLKQHLEKNLPFYMVPQYFQFIESFPLTKNKKIDKKKLALNFSNNESNDSNSKEVLEKEEKLISILETLLGISNISGNDNFFEVGGDSIIGIQFISRANNIGIYFDIHQLFKAKTITELAISAKIVRLKTTSNKKNYDMPEGEILLSPIQQWFFEKDLVDPNHFNQAVLLDLNETISFSMIKKTFLKLINHHDMLRTKFSHKDGKIVQEYLPMHVLLTKVDSIFNEVDFSHEGALALALFKEKMHASLNIFNGLLLRVTFIKTEETKSQLLIIAHHLLIDGVSWRILLQDLNLLLSSLLTNQDDPLAIKTMSYQSWSNYLREKASDLEQAKSYWLNIPDNIPARLADRDSHIDYDSVGVGSVSINLNSVYTRGLLHEVNQAYKTQINDILLTALVLTIGDFNKNYNLLINLEGHGRHAIDANIDVSRTVGWFTSIFPVLLQLSDSSNLPDSIKEIKSQLDAVPDFGMSYGIMKYLSTETVDKLNAIDICFNYLGQFNSSDKENELFKMSTELSGHEVGLLNPAIYSLEINSKVQDGTFQMTWRYDSKHYSRQKISQVAESYLTNLKAIIDHCRLAKKSFDIDDFTLLNLEKSEIDNYLNVIPNLETAYPLSSLQEGLLFHYLSQPDSEAYFVQSLYVIQGKLDSVLFKKAWQYVAEFHPILRTKFLWEGLTDPIQYVENNLLLDWSEENLDRELDQIAVEELLKKDRSYRFDFKNDNLMRFRLLKVNDTQCYFIWDFHHILIDGWCVSLILDQVLSVYSGFLLGKESIGLDKAPTYQDYITWINKQDKKIAVDFWRSYLESSQVSCISKLPVSTSADSALYHLDFTFSSDISDRVREYAKANHLTLNVIMQTVWSLCLADYLQQMDVCFGVTVSTRPTDMPNSEKMVGLFINTIIQRIKFIKSSNSIISIMQTVQDIFADMYKNSYFSLAEIQSIARVKGEKNLFDTLFVFENFPASNLIEKTGSISFQSLKTVEKTEYPLTILVWPENALRLRFSYHEDRLSSLIVKDLFAKFNSILMEIVSSSNMTVGDILPAECFLNKASVATSSSEQHDELVYSRSKNEVEQKLSEIWCEILNVKEVSLNDSFFELGGHSLLASRLISKIRNVYNVNIAFKMLFDSPKLFELANQVNKLLDSNDVTVVMPKIKKR